MEVLTLGKTLRWANSVISILRKAVTDEMAPFLDRAGEIHFNAAIAHLKRAYAEPGHSLAHIKSAADAFESAYQSFMASASPNTPLKRFFRNSQAVSDAYGKACSTKVFQALCYESSGYSVSAQNCMKEALQLFRAYAHWILTIAAGQGDPYDTLLTVTTPWEAILQEEGRELATLANSFGLSYQPPNSFLLDMP